MSTHVLFFVLSISIFFYNIYLPKHINMIKEKNKTDGEVFWFLHISDLHISHQSEIKERRKLIRFKKLVKRIIPKLKPKFVIASGDITHALTRLRANQVLYEWESYSNTLKKEGYFNSTFWMDTKGNHDVFNDDKNYFHHHLSCKDQLKSRRVFSNIYQVKSMKYKVIGIDSTPKEKFTRLLSMFGHLDQNDLKEIEKELSGDQNVTIVYSHYPITFIKKETTTSGLSLNQLFEKYHVSAYLCGHIHNVYGFGNEAQVIQKEGYMELEVADFGLNNIIRIGAFDQNRLSFVDFNPFIKKTVILITNPKDSRYLTPFENDMLNTDSIRFLVINSSKIEKISIKIDGKILENKVEKFNENLYKMKWNPQDYKESLHELEISVTEENNITTETRQMFSLDGSVSITKTSMIPRILFQVEWTKVLIIEFFILHFYIIYLIYYRVIQLSDQKRLNLLIVCIYILFGPLLLIEVKDNIFGFIFSWGIITNEFNFSIWRADPYFGYFIFFEIFTLLPYVLINEKYHRVNLIYMLWRIYASYKYFSLYSLSRAGMIFGLFSPIGPLFLILFIIIDLVKIFCPIRKLK